MGYLLKVKFIGRKSGSIGVVFNNEITLHFIAEPTIQKATSEIYNKGYEHVSNITFYHNNELWGVK